MKLTVFQSDKGDCLLIEGSNGTTLLADGGMAASYSKHVAPSMNRLRKAGRSLDLVYVSHIDADHIAGILQMMDDEVGWRVYEHQQAQGNPKASKLKPKSPRPPAVRAVWHNAFHDQIQKNRGALEELFIASMKTNLLAEELRENLERLDDLMTSERQALLLRHRLSAKQLGIPVNGPSAGHLMFIGQGATVNNPIALGELTITVVGPRNEELENLRKRWNDWIRDNEEAIRRIREQAREEAERLHADEARSFQAALGSLAQQLGDRRNVSVPNLASLMLVVEDAGKSLLLTGDSHPDDIRAGLELDGRLDATGRAHFDVIKFQHHGSKNNVDEDFCAKITADHYVFCGDGGHHNPHLDAVDMLIRGRRQASSRPFKLWFNSSEAVTHDSRKAHMRKLEDRVATRAAASGGQLRYRFLRRGSKLTLNA
ncbi:MAG TPA: MBL fold metallo-hydrolase [Thermoanaerobaculia bacterium]|nr:MBL fold metallo-hydrolase [Thermoanaerobaculia bacterium]